MSRVSGRIVAVGISAALLVVCGSTARAETRVLLSQTHTKKDLYSACDGVGGIKLQGEKGGWGCYNPKNGNMVACGPTGVCTGYIPRQGAPSPRDLSLLKAVPARPETEGSPAAPR